MQNKPARIRTTDLSKTALIITAAGRGVRFGGYKQIAPLNGKPLIVHAMEAFFGLPFHTRIIVLPAKMISDGTWSSIVIKHSHAAEFQVVQGKDDRAGSVRAGLAETPPACEFVVVHDGVRPFPPLQAMVDALVVVKSEPDVAGAVVCSPVTDTIKRVPRGAMFVQKTEDRDELRRAETPQVAKRELLMEAMANFQRDDSPPTDEAEALERMKLKVALFEHGGFNPKITTPQDLIMAQSYLQSSAETHAPKNQ
ncbi:2-C-methyl-D-erythritol 4-phosphate cytidylyltransferase [Candidatus Sumerlaeota bacterium]|nr:2-C-methyl-D-erythritol 4-phosphate cytidylyltransferase [Candidatus Sumerlaeota bacterium]